MRETRELYDLSVICDPQKAAEDKIRVDIERRKAARWPRITGAILLLFILTGGIAYIMHKCGVLDCSWCVLVWCLTPFPAILWFVVWCSNSYIPYTANTQYWLLTARNSVQKMYISRPNHGRYSWPAMLNIVIKKENGKTKTETIDIGYLSHYCDDITQDVVDFTLQDEEGVWFEPAARKRADLERHVTSMKQWAQHYLEGKDDH